MFSSRSIAASFPSGKVCLGTTNTGNNVEMLLPNINASEFKFCGRIEVVGKQPGIIKWQSNSATFVTADYSNRYIKEEIGSIIPGVSGECQWGPMEKTAVTHAHKNSADSASGFFNFHQDIPQQVFSCLNGKYGRSHILSKNGRHHQS